TGEAALDAVASQRFDLVVLDLVLPDMGGIDVCRSLREWSRVPVIVLSVHAEEEVKIRALNGGADEYITKPFSAPELIARMESMLRRASWEATPVEPIIRADNGEVEIDLARRMVSRGGTDVHLTPVEFELLAFLARNAGRLITHGMLLRSALGPTSETATGTLRVHIGSLRKKLEQDSSNPRIIITEPGIGYRLRADPSRTL